MSLESENSHGVGKLAPTNTKNFKKPKKLRVERNSFTDSDPNADIIPLVKKQFKSIITPDGIKQFNSVDSPHKQNEIFKDAAFSGERAIEEQDEEEEIEEDLNQIKKILNWEVVYDAPYFNQDLLKFDHPLPEKFLEDQMTINFKGVNVIVEKNQDQIPLLIAEFEQINILKEYF